MLGKGGEQDLRLSYQKWKEKLGFDDIQAITHSIRLPFFKHSLWLF